MVALGVNGGLGGITSRSIGVDNQWKDEHFNMLVIMGIGD
jgi:hypothetical protein